MKENDYYKNNLELIDDVYSTISQIKNENHS